MLNLMQWPAMGLTLIGAWLVGSQSRKKRSIGFWTYLASNVLWVIWGWHDKAYAVIVLQLFLVVLNVRGVFKNDPELKAKVASA